MWRKKGQSLLVLSVMMWMVFGGSLGAEEASQGAYTVRKGDTLWHISGTYLKDPRLWPKIWEMNRYIKNPNLIYPGDPIAIPGRAGEVPSGEEAATPPEGAVGSGGLATAPEAVEGAASKAAPATGEEEKAAVKAKASSSMLPPVEPAPVVTPQIAAYSGFIGKDEVFRERRRIVQAFSQKNELAAGDLVMVNMGSQDNVKVGDRFSILRPSRKIYHPLRRKRMGVLVLNAGWLEITEVQDRCSKAEIAYSFLPVFVGDRLVPYEAPSFPADLKAEPTTQETRGCIVDCLDAKAASGARDIVYIDVGTNQQIAPGDLFSISRVESKPRGSACDPSWKIGELVVLRTGQETSSAYILKSTMEVERGNLVVLEKKAP